MKKYAVIAVLLLSFTKIGIGFNSLKIKDCHNGEGILIKCDDYWCSGKDCSKPGYWYDVEKEDLAGRYDCIKYCSQRGGGNRLEDVTSGGRKYCKCAQKTNCPDQNYWANCGGVWKKTNMTEDWFSGKQKNASAWDACITSEGCGGSNNTLDGVISQDTVYCKCRQ